MKPITWWQYGLFGAFVLSACTLIKVVAAVPRFFVEDVPWGELVYFPAQVVALGFSCGVAVWAMRAVWKRWGVIGDVVTGIVVIETLFLGYMLLSDPAMLFEKPRDVLLMFMLGVGFGALGGYIIGRDLRKELATPPDESEDT
ncbi:MAG: hypothetical protein JNM18_11610 [Planctomycetaceae bacterium]|nr:hypothetical protein [Planctomycetaceae bacterium]